MKGGELQRTIEDAQSGDPKAFERIYRHFHNDVFRYLILRGVPRDDAEELCDEVFVHIWKELDRFKVR